MFHVVRNLFSLRSKLSTGIQITDHVVRFASFRIKKKQIALHAYGERFLSEGVVRHGRIINPDALIQTLDTLAREYDFTNVTAILSEEQSFIFHTMIPETEAVQLQTIVEDHIRSYLELHEKQSASGFVCEYDVLATHDGVHDLQVTVTPQSILTSYEHVFESAGLHLESIEVGAHMVSRACLSNTDEASCLLVDFGEDRTHVSVVSGADVMETGTVSRGEQHLIPVIEKFLNVNHHEAEQIKNRYGVSHAHREPALLSELAHELSPIREFIDQSYVRWHSREYKTKKQQLPIQKIVLYGTGSHMRGFAEHLAIATRIPVEHAQVWRNYADYYDAVPEIPYEESHRYASVIGAALKDF